MEIKLSTLKKTWVLDLDGTLLKHNGYKNGGDEVLPGAKEFTQSVYATDRVIILTARKEACKEETIRFLDENGIKYHDILFDIPEGERILINDVKPRGLKTAIALNKERDKGIDIEIIIDENM